MATPPSPKSSQPSTFRDSARRTTTYVYLKKSHPYSPRQKPALRGVDETPEEFRSLITEVINHKILGETSEAVKPCLEEYEKDLREPVIDPPSLGQ